MTEVEQALKEASAPGYSGEVTVTFRDGAPAVVHISKTRQIKKDNPYNGNSPQNR